MRFGFHPLSDFYSPQKMLEETLMAEKYGFTDIFYADHLHPWSTSEGTSFAWTLIASAAERTKNVRIGTAVTCPMLRYNPAIVAQAFASLGATYPGRIFLGVGTGEALNEVPAGLAWPNGKTRLEMLEESIKVIRWLWDQEYVSFEGKHFSLREANLFTKPPLPVPLYVSALGPKAAYLAGRLGDGWITLNLPDERLKQVLSSFESGVKARSNGQDYGGDSGKPLKIAEIIVSYDRDLEKAIEACRPLAGTLSPQVFHNEIIDPRKIRAIGDKVDKKTLGEAMLATNNSEKVISALAKFHRLDFDIVEVVSVSPEQENFMKLFRENVVPQFS